MTARSLALGLSLLAAAALPVQAQDAATLTDIVVGAQQSPEPTASFLRGLERLEDGELDAAAVESAALRTPPGSPLADLLAGVRSIRKVGGLVTIERQAPVEVSLGQGTLRLGATVRLAIDQGEFDTLRPADRERLGDADAARGFTRVRAIAGAELDGAPLRALVTVEEDGQPVTHVARGELGATEWARVGAAPTAAQAEPTALAQAQPASPEPAAQRDGLVDRIDDVAADLAPAAAGADPASDEAPAVEDAAAAGQASAAPAAPGSAPGGVVPEPEEKARVDEAADAVVDDMNALATDIDDLERLWEADQEAARVELEALLAELEADNARLEAELADLRRQREDAAASGDTPFGPPVADGPRLDRDRPDLARSEPLTREGEDAAASDEEAAAEEKEETSPLERLLLALVEGLSKGLTQGLTERFAGAAATNIESKGEMVAITTAPEHRPYVDARLGNGLQSSGLWRMPTSAQRPRVLRIVPGQAITPLAAPAPASSAPAGPTPVNAPLGLNLQPLGR